LASSCVVCERTTSGSLEFCARHYQEYKQDIKDHKPWVKALKNDAQRERRRREREYDNTSLDAIMENYSNRRNY
jgi:hypothetical protein